SQRLEPSLLDRYFKGSSSLSVTVSNKPPLNVNRLVRGLLEYPYGCLEQTTSAAYPHLFIDEAAARDYGLKPRTREERARFVDGAIARLAGMQKSNGGFTLWGDGAYEVWLSAYVVGFLQDARAQGFSVPDTMYKSAQDWLLQQLQQAPNRFPSLPASARAKPASAPLPTFDSRDYVLLRDSHQRFAEMAHVGYMLARDQKAPLATLRYLHDHVRDRARSPLPLVHLALALKLMGDEARAKVALDDAMSRDYGIHGSRYAWETEWLGDYGSAARDLALSYALLVRHQVAHSRRENLLFDLANRLGTRNYYSTQERMALFLAARAAGGESGGAWRASLKSGDDVQALGSRGGSEQRSLDPAMLGRGASVVNEHKDALFVEVEAAGYPIRMPSVRNEVIELQRDWFEPDGKAWKGRPLKAGDMLIVRVRARAKTRIEDALIVDRIPAGFEVENLNISQGPKAGEFSIDGVNLAVAMADQRIKHREYRDDRYVAAARLDGQWLPVFYMVRVVSPGRFVVPPSFGEDMYRPEMRGIGNTPEPVTIQDPRPGPP
ncbi:MAG TPA: alpha-2-macroglobulin family protein, partial [Burkholderiaceae bacterium]|nr:alpha-2-macroglobulin family protein [Burkholderiaceae bacterium]